METPVVALQHRRKRWQIPKNIRGPYFVTVLILAITFFITLSFYPSLQPDIPLFYTLSEPEQQLVRKEFVFILPAMGILILFINTSALVLLARVDAVMMRLAMWTTIMIEIILCFSLLRILLIT